MHENIYKLSRVDSVMYVTIAFATRANYLSRWGRGSLQLLPIALRLTRAQRQSYRSKQQWS